MATSEIALPIADLIVAAKRFLRLGSLQVLQESELTDEVRG